jgi:hypothetical protein
MAWYTVKLGSYTFTTTPDVQITTTEVVRQNAAPNLLVARNYEWTFPRCRVRGDAPTDVVTALQAFLTAAVNARAFPTSLEIENAAGTDLAQIGAVTAGTAENWEDLRVTEFSLAASADTPTTAQLVSGAEFSLTFAARRSFPDSNGVCEFDQDREIEADSFGNETRRKTTTVRLARNYVNGTSASNTILTTAIADEIAESCPVGWRRTKGSTSVPFIIRYPLWPLTHLAVCVSEVAKTAVGAGAASPPTGAIKAVTAERIVEDPEKGVKRFFFSAETVGATDGLTWVEAQRPSQGTGETEDRPADKTAKGKWQYLEPLVGGQSTKVTRIKRSFVRGGGGRVGGAFVLSSPYTPKVTVGPYTPQRLVETVLVYALGATTLDDIPLPAQLPESTGWVLVEPSQTPDPSVDEDSRWPEQRLWRRAVTREYLWAKGATDPLTDTDYKAALLADAGLTL